MIRKLFITFILLVFCCLFLASLELDNNTIHKNKNFFDLCLAGGLSVTSAGDLPGGGVGFNVGYSYLFTDYFAFGPGASAYFGIPHFGTQTGAVLLFKFMIGPIKKQKIAFLLDVGGGWLFQINLGLYIKGVAFRAGYLLTTFGAVHNIVFDIGYKIHW